MPNTALYNLRNARAESQEDLAAALNRLAGAQGRATALTGNHISRWERGVNYPSPLYRRLLAEHFGVTVAELGLVRQRSVPTGHPGQIVGPGDFLTFNDGEPDEDQERCRQALSPDAGTPGTSSSPPTRAANIQGRRERVTWFVKWNQVNPGGSWHSVGTARRVLPPEVDWCGA
jgi:transcriptional regulator with XRE-family HTH domain